MNRPGREGAGPPSWSWEGLHQPDDVSLGIGEESDGGARRDLGEGHQDPPAELLDLLQRGRGVVRLDVERDTSGTTVRCGSDPAPDGVVLALDHPVTLRVVGVQLPAEDRGVEALKGGAVLAHDLEVDDLARHSQASSRGEACLALVT